MKEKVTFSKVVYEALDELDKVMNDINDAITRIADNHPNYENDDPFVQQTIALLEAAEKAGREQIGVIRSAEEKEAKEVHDR